MTLHRRVLPSTLVALLACGTAAESPGGDDDDDATADAGDDPGGEPATIAGCDGAALYELPPDPARRGPWPVGARSVAVGRLGAEIWYPARRGSEVDRTPITYDIRRHLPMSQQALIPDADNPWQPCDCYAELPIDDVHGPYPVVVFVHGTASFRTQSLAHVTHWASRGFVVVAADHPGLKLADSLALLCPDPSSGAQDLSGDVDALLAAVAAGGGDLAFLAGRVAVDRVAVTGHSAGGGAVAGFSGKPGVRVVMPFSSGTAVTDHAALEQVLFISGENDAIARFAGVESAYAGSPSPRRLVGIAQAGHLVVTDLCELRNGAGENMLEVAQRHGICGTALAGGLFDCESFYIGADMARPIVDHATSAVLETALHCTDRTDAFADFAARYPAVATFEYDP